MREPLLSPRLLQLWKTRFQEVPLYCGNDSHVGVDEISWWRDWSRRETTQDQARIEDYLETACGKDDTLLHVGLGNSSLAKRFAGTCSSIVGISITKREVEQALTLDIPNYYPLLLNKYSTTFADAFGAQFDWIVDNNPSTFSCCFLHLCRMVQTYRNLLTERGQIVTDARGLGWVVTRGNQRWRFDFADWQAITDEFGLVTEKADDNIYVSRLAASALKALKSPPLFGLEQSGVEKPPALPEFKQRRL